VAGQSTQLRAPWALRALLLLVAASLAGACGWWLARVAGVSPGPDSMGSGVAPVPTPEALLLVALGAALAAFGVSERGRRRALGDMHAQETRARSVVELQTEWITCYDTDLRLTFVNGAFARMEGRRQDEIVGTSMADMKDAEGLARMRAQLSTLTPEHPSASFDVPLTLKDGTKAYRRWTDLAVFDEQGQVREYLSVGRDVTEQKRA
jgi:PAS domain S-box-containing protein